MLYQVEYETAFHPGNMATTKIIESRSQYRHCHITVPDLEHPVAALCVDGEFYSFLKAVKEAEKAIEIAAKLGNSGDKTVITKTPKGYVIWVKEPEGYSVLLS
ncbi:hypothetical protein [Kamptonema sp. UHCC 0994]|uniref:hypothetical protein n=1 Tax=Kamptonema sp. UHCC 0994 TaxID=3031329 RepID=UPI0023B9E4D1|nr:hypothetical protein [Kamptonema sp. UHCC 0994]MDF0554744.1 hypothetical protein [Kamptonema sp. UHCC 0994]